MAARESGARERILARVRSALRTGRIPQEAEPPAVEFSLERATPGQLLERFVAELGALNVTVHREASAAAVAARVRLLVAGRSLLAWERAALPYGLGTELADLPMLHGDAPRAAKATADVGLTGVDLAIAETGSLVVVSGKAHARTASLLPPIHIAVVRPEEIVPTLGACLRRLGPAIPGASAVNIITGPSRTADIELRLTLGVHGPGELIVVVGP